MGDSFITPGERGCSLPIDGVELFSDVLHLWGVPHCRNASDCRRSSIMSLPSSRMAMQQQCLALDYIFSLQTC